MDLKIGDDIECIRFFRNKYYVYVEFVKIFDSEFKDFWNEGKFLIYCIQIYIIVNGCIIDYGLKLINILGCMIKYEEYIFYVNFFRGNWNFI